MDRCKTLHNYAVLVSLIRRYAKALPLRQAVNKAINECIEQDILADFLRKNRAEVFKMSIYEYDEEKHIQQERHDAKEEGKAEGIMLGRSEGILLRDITLICKKLQKGKDISQIAKDLEEDISYIERIYKTAQNYAPDYNEEKIFDAVMSKNS